MDIKVVPQKISVGVVDRQVEISGHLNGRFSGEGWKSISGGFSARAESGKIALFDEANHVVFYSPLIHLRPEKNALFSLNSVPIGSRFHWEKAEGLTFRGDLILRCREDGSICAINEIPIEEYLTSVISSEMNPAAPIEFLKAHTILSRSWVFAALNRKKERKRITSATEKNVENETIRWYDRTDHDLFDVCADDHCQRYQGIKRTLSGQAEAAVRETDGVVVMFEDEICDTRYSKACGGRTERFETAWEDQPIPYLTSVSDSSLFHPPIETEKEAKEWIVSEPIAYCNIKDRNLLQAILSETDLKTMDFFRWRVEYTQTELEDILREKSGIDFGTLKEILSLQRGPSGRISRCEIIGTKKSLTIGKELEIRRWFSRTHLYSSAFVVIRDGDRWIFQGAGWGHGVGLCQIGAAVMASQGATAEEILKHYFKGIALKKIY